MDAVLIFGAWSVPKYFVRGNLDNDLANNNVFTLPYQFRNLEGQKACWVPVSSSPCSCHTKISFGLHTEVCSSGCHPGLELIQRGSQDHRRRNPSSTQCGNDVMTTSSWRHYNVNDVTASSQCFVLQGKPIAVVESPHCKRAMSDTWVSLRLSHLHAMTSCANWRCEGEELFWLDVHPSIEHLVHGNHITCPPTIVQWW